MSLPKSITPTALLALIIVLLAALTGLQYHWIGELSDFQRQQMERALRSSTDRLVHGFEDELERLYYTFRVRGERRADTDIAEEYAEWRERTEFPALVTAAYWVRDERDYDKPLSERLSIARISVTDGRFEAVPWPAELTALQEPLAASAVAREGHAFRESDSFTTDAGGAGYAFVVAQTHLRGKSWAVVLLDRDVLFDELLPALVTEHFGPVDEREFRVGVFDDAAADHMLYGSTGDLAPTFDPATDTISADYTRHFREFGGMLRTRDEGGGRTLAVAATHRAGSVDTAVAQLRRRNLGFSFGVVLVLAASVVVLAVAGRRARRLAERQMEFVAGVSHELRTPIAGISSLSQNLADGVVDDLGQAARYGDAIHAESRRLTNMVEGVLHFSAIRSGRYRYEMGTETLGDVVRAALDGLDPAAVADHPLTVSIDEDLPPVRGDGRALQSVVRNLVSNALKFSEKGGSVRVSACTLPSAGGGQIELRVEDSGPGISAAEIPHLFEPFFRGRSAQAEQIQGSGLGLSLVKEIVDAHHGRIEVSSQQGKGSTFRVLLPVAGPATRDAELGNKPVADDAESGDEPAAGAGGLQPAGDGGGPR